MELGFRLFGLPVRISVFFLLVGIIIRPAEAQGSPALSAAWLVVMFVGVLVHELGHGLTARAFGQQPAILLHGWGGVTYWNPTREVSSGRRLLISAAGPAVGVAVGLACEVIRALLATPGTPFHFILGFAVWVNLGWGVLNLLPFLPLDGGQVLASFLEILGLRSGRRVVHWLSLVVSALAAVGCAIVMYVFGVLFFGLMAYANYMALRPPPPPPRAPDEGPPAVPQAPGF